jgi:hypothetical protein
MVTDGKGIARLHYSCRSNSAAANAAMRRSIPDSGPPSFRMGERSLAGRALQKQSVIVAREHPRRPVAGPPFHEHAAETFFLLKG